MMESDEWNMLKMMLFVYIIGIVGEYIDDSHELFENKTIIEGIIKNDLPEYGYVFLESYHDAVFNILSKFIENKKYSLNGQNILLQLVE